MLKLFLLRHGKATKFIDDKSDFTRHLNRQGVVQTNQVGYIVREKKASIDQLICSGAVRTLETAEIMNHYLAIRRIESDDDLYLAKHDQILRKICESGSGKNLLYVGHNNGISDLASYLSGKAVNLSTGHLVEIHFNLDDWNLITKASGHFVSEIIPDIHS